MYVYTYTYMHLCMYLLYQNSCFLIQTRSRLSGVVPIVRCLSVSISFRVTTMMKERKGRYAAHLICCKRGCMQNSQQHMFVYIIERPSFVATHQK